MTKLNVLFLILITTLVLALSVRGHAGTPRDSVLSTPYWREEGPFELSPERGRYALTYAIVENRSFAFTPHLAAFVAPDVAVSGSSFVSLFPPGLSYISLPGYIVGKYFGHAQVGAFATSAFFALCNVVLIYILSRRMGAIPAAATAASLLFAFGTPAFPYAVSLYQHHLTTTLLLLSCVLVTGTVTFLKLASIWFLMAMAFVVDVPNLIFFIPIAMAAALRFFSLQETPQGLALQLKPQYLLSIVTAFIPLAVLFSFNTASYGDPFQLGGMMRRATQVEVAKSADGEVTANVAEFESGRKAKKTAAVFLETRNVPNGLYTHFLAPERGLIFFAPITLVSFLGMYAYRKRKIPIASLLLSTAAVIVILYSLWGDPYGGWAFGSRYMIPAYALLAPYLALAITYYRKDVLFFVLLVIVSIYSVAVNTVGALTTSAAPPGPELKHLQEISGLPQPGGYMPNVLSLVNGHSKSFAYEVWASRYMHALTFAILIGGVIILYLLLLYLAAAMTKKEAA